MKSIIKMPACRSFSTGRKTFKKNITVFVFMLSALTINAQVFQEWVQRFNGPDSLFDRAVAIGADGCIYVTGSSFSIASKDDYVTIKYDKQGNQKWAAVLNGVANGEDIPTAIAIDKQCNVYVTGFSTGGAFNQFDFVTVKYDSSGVQQWVQRFDGASGLIDVGNAIAVDPAGNVYVTGSTIEGNTARDITIKYNSAGMQQWIAKGNDVGGTGIALDAQSNVYIIAGSQFGKGGGGSIFSDFVTAKYNASGVQQWRVRFGTDNSFDLATGLAVDAEGNVAVTGFTNGFINADFATIKYNTNGVEQWVQRFNGPLLNSDDRAAAIVLDSKGNVTVTGKSGTSTSHDFTTIQYTKNGKLNWMQTFNGPGNGDDFATAIATDNNDNIYITGASAGVGSDMDYATIKYAQSGALQWTQRFNGAANGFDLANDIAIDSDGNVYVTGMSQIKALPSGGALFEFATVKYGQGIIPPVVAFGLEHTRLGNAKLGAANNTLEISNIGSSGNDGFQISLQESEGVSILGSPFPGVQTVTDGSFIKMQSIHNQTLSSSIREEVSGNDINVIADFKQLGTITHLIRVFNNGRLIAQETHSDSVDIKIDISTMKGVQTDKLVCSGQDGTVTYIRVWLGAGSGNAASAAMRLQSGNVVVGDAYSITAVNQRTLVTTSPFVNVTFKDIPNFTITNEAIKKFGFFNSSLTGTKISASNGNLIASNIGSGGQDGIKIDLTKLIDSSITNFSYNVELTKAPAFPVGARLVSNIVSKVDGVENQPSGAIVTKRVSIGFEITPDFSSIGSTSYQLQLFNKGLLVFSEQNKSGAAGIVEVNNSGKKNITNVNLSYNLTQVSYSFGKEKKITMSGGNVIKADKMVFVPENATKQINSFSDIDVTGKDIQLFTITNELSIN